MTSYRQIAALLVWAGIAANPVFAEQEEDWAVRLKHFNPDFSGWEEKTDYVNFKFESVSDNKAVFGGLSYEVIEGNKLVVSLRMRQDDGSVTTEYFHFTRKEL